MADVLTYTTYADVRAILGVSDDELADATLALDVYADSLNLALLDLSTDLPTLYAATIATLEADRTTDQQKFLMLTSQFATYQVARQAGIALPMVAQQITDGKAAMARFTSGPYREVLARLEGEFGNIRKLLVDAISILTGSATSATYIPSLLGGAAPSIDRVTNS